MAFRSPPPHRRSSGNNKSKRRRWRASQSKYGPHQGDREIERRRRHDAEICFRRALRGASVAMMLKAVEDMTQEASRG